VNFGLNYSGGSEGRSYLDARLRVTRLEMNRFGSEWRTDVQIGRTTALGTEFYQPLSWTRVPFASMGLRYRNKYEDWFLGDFNLGELQSKEVTVTPELGLRIFHYGEVRAGIEYGHMKANDRTRLGLYDFDGVRGGYNVELNLDMLDAAVFPTRGYRLRARTFFGSETFGSGLNYTKALVQGSVVTTVSGNTFTLGVRGGSSLGTSLPEFDMFTAGGPENLQGYRPAQFRGQETGVASLAWYRKIKGHPSPYSTSWYVGARLEAGNAWRFREDAGLDDLRYCASASLMISTILGPLSFTYGRAEDGDDTLTMTLGRTASFFD
jgi:NTE family protein